MSLTLRLGKPSDFGKDRPGKNGVYPLVSSNTASGAGKSKNDHLVMTNIAIDNGPLPMKNGGSFHGYVTMLNNQMVLSGDLT